MYYTHTYTHTHTHTVPPTPPTNIRVLASNTSTYIQWSAPQYPGDIFGKSIGYV